MYSLYVLGVTVLLPPGHDLPEDFRFDTVTGTVRQATGAFSIG